jgi:hypothetical protein
MAASLAWNVGGAGGGAARTTTDREMISAGGRGAAAGSRRAEIRSAPAVGTAGSVPRRTGAEATWVTTARSLTTAPVTIPPETNVLWLTTVMYVRLT